MFDLLWVKYLCYVKKKKWIEKYGVNMYKKKKL